MMLNKTEKKLKKSIFSYLILIALTASILIVLTVWRKIRTQIKNFLHPSRTQFPHTPSDFAIEQWENANFASSDGLRLSGWYIPPDPESEGSTLIFIHGHGQNRGELLAEAAMLKSHGYGALLFDLRNSGESEGKITTGYTEVEDVKGAVNYLLNRSEVNPCRIGLVGHSLGGVIAIQAAVHILEVRAVIAQAAFTSLNDRLQEMLRNHHLPRFPFNLLIVWFFKKETEFDLNNVNSIDNVGCLSPCAIMLVHGKRDDRIPVGHSQLLYKFAKEPKDLYIISNADHSGWHLMKSNPKEFEQRLVNFLNVHLKHSSSTRNCSY